MNNVLNNNFSIWLQSLATEWQMPIEQVALGAFDEEIMNRVENYPKVAAALTASEFDFKKFATAVRGCWVMFGRFDGTRFTEYVNRGEDASKAIFKLIEDFPEDELAVANRINQFTEYAVNIGFSGPGKKDLAGAASFVSLMLTSLYPSRFVDFRRGRWKGLAEKFGYEAPASDASYGDWIIWAGKFAIEICNLPIYNEFWPYTENRFSNPLWVVSGICWTALKPTKPSQEPIDLDVLSFPEGAEKRRLHLLRERNRAIIEKAKAIGFDRDPMLRCKICGFSFLEMYGERGRRFIEAHHKQPIAELKAGSRTRLEDLALVCANCHRMLHYGDRTLDINELKGLLHD